MMFGVDGFVLDMENEAQRARGVHGRFHSAHEAYAVLLEELDEFWQEVKRKEPDADAMYRELVQVAAMALCAALECATPAASDGEERER